MNYMKRAQIYKGANVTFDPTKIEAHSYRWWRFVAKIDGVVFFNSYRYSVSTAKHQSKVRSLMHELNIKIDIEAPFPDGIGNIFLDTAIIEAEEGLCNAYLREEAKRDDRNAKAKTRRLRAKTCRLRAKIEDYCENQIHFRDYSIVDRRLFGNVHDEGVHQIVDADSVEYDIENAIYDFHHNGSSSVVFYV